MFLSSLSLSLSFLLLSPLLRFNFASFVHILTAKRFFLLLFPFSFFLFFSLPPLPLVIGRLSTETTECTCYRLAWNFLAPIFPTTYLEQLLLKSIPALLPFSLLSSNGSEFVEDSSRLVSISQIVGRANRSDREREKEREGGIFAGYCIKFAFLRVEEGKILVKLFLLLELAIASFRKFTCNSFRIVCYEFLNRIEFPKLTLGNKIFLFRL